MNRSPDQLIALLRRIEPFLQQAGERTGYGFFRPKNPHDFTPDFENTPDEIAAHKAACEAYDKGTYVPDNSDGWIAPGIHVTKAPWGIGSYIYLDPNIAELLDEIRSVLA